MYFAIAELKDRNHHKDNMWINHNQRIGGYKHIKKAINAILKHHSNGSVVNENRITVALVQDSKITYPK